MTAGGDAVLPHQLRPGVDHTVTIDKKVGKRLKDFIFSVGNTIDPAQAYRNFRGRDPIVDALMIKRGFPVIKK